MGQCSFNRLTTIPYDLELRDTIDVALFHLQALEQAAQQCRELDKKLIDDSRTIDPEVFIAKGREQSRMFDELEAFLASWARVSLIVFPVSKNPFAALYSVPDDTYYVGLRVWTIFGTTAGNAWLDELHVFRIAPRQVSGLRLLQYWKPEPAPAGVWTRSRHQESPRNARQLQRVSR